MRAPASLETGRQECPRHWPRGVYSHRNMSPALLLFLLVGTRQQPLPPKTDTCLCFISENLAKGNGNWFTYFKISDQQLVIKEGDVLRYEVFLDPRNPVAKGGMDVDPADNSDALRDTGAVDQNGLRAHGDAMLTPAVGKWYRREISLDRLRGKTSAAWNLVFEGDDAGTYVQFVDDIEVDHKDGTKTVLYGDGTPKTRELLMANGYTNNPACEAVDRSLVKEGANLDAVIRSVSASAAKLRVLSEVRKDIDVAKEFSKRNPSAHLEGHVAEAMNLLSSVDKKPNPTTEELQAALHAAQHALSHVHPEMTKYTGHLVGHAHIDLQWLWEWQEGIVASRDTFAQAVKFMDEVPGFTFSQSSSTIYQAVEETYPELFTKIKAKVAKGQWELLGGRICEGDTNMISPESHAMQFLYGQRYFRERFGKSAVVGWEPDTFGHTIQMPQILKMGGCDYYYFCRGGKGKPLFWWEGLDGTKMLTFDEPASGSWYNSDLSYKQFKEMIDFYDGTGSKDMLWVYGVGNHGGGPTREHIQEAVKWMQKGYLPNVRFSTATNFFKALEKYDLSKIPAVNQELNPVFDGCYTTHSEIKQANRDAEAWTTSAEAVASVASLNGFHYPKAEFRRNWEEICYNHHHDTLPGSGIHAPYEKTKVMLARVILEDKDIITRALETLTQRVTPPKGGISVMVFNPTGWRRSAWCETLLVQSGWNPDAPLDPNHCTAVAPDGKKYAVDVLDEPSRKARFWAADVPAFGYRVFHIVNGEVVKPAVQARDGGYTLENDNFVVEFDKTRGLIKRLYDKKAQRTIAASGLGRLEAHFESPQGMSAWVLGKIDRVEALVPDSSEVQQGADYGEVSFSYRMPSVNNPKHDTLVRQTFRLEGGGSQITCDMDCTWNQIGSPTTANPNLRVAFDTGVAKPVATYEVPFGALARPLDGIEYPALKWADVSGDDYGVSVFNDCKHGHSAEGTTLRLTLIRSSFSPDPVPNPGQHHWRYAIYPHAGTWKSAGTVQKATEFNQPMLDATVPFEATGKNPLQWGLVDISHSNIAPTALKAAEDGSGLVLRMYESAGMATDGSMKLNAPLTNDHWVNFIEDSLGVAQIRGSVLPLKLHRFEIRSIKLDWPTISRPPSRSKALKKPGADAAVLRLRPSHGSRLRSG